MASVRASNWRPRPSTTALHEEGAVTASRPRPRCTRTMRDTCAYDAVHLCILTVQADTLLFIELSSEFWYSKAWARVAGTAPELGVGSVGGGLRASWG
jgi:hypothetical protein